VPKPEANSTEKHVANNRDRSVTNHGTFSAEGRAATLWLRQPQLQARIAKTAKSAGKRFDAVK
jgi:hypothetical protein